MGRFVLVVVLCAALSGCYVDDTADPPAHPEDDDVTFDSCGAGADGLLVSTVLVDNRSSERSSYRMTVSFYDAAGTLIASAGNDDVELDPGDSTVATFQTETPAPSTPVTCDFGFYDRSSEEDFTFYPD